MTHFNPELFSLSLLAAHQLPELLAALLLAEQKVGCSLRWRLHEKLLQRYSYLARLLPGEVLHQSFSPRIFIILTTNVSNTALLTAQYVAVQHVNQADR